MAKSTEYYVTLYTLCERAFSHYCSITRDASDLIKIIIFLGLGAADDSSNVQSSTFTTFQNRFCICDGRLLSCCCWSSSRCCCYWPRNCRLRVVCGKVEWRWGCSRWSAFAGQPADEPTCLKDVVGNELNGEEVTRASCLDGLQLKRLIRLLTTAQSPGLRLTIQNCIILSIYQLRLIHTRHSGLRFPQWAVSMQR